MILLGALIINLSIYPCHKQGVTTLWHRCFKKQKSMFSLYTYSKYITSPGSPPTLTIIPPVPSLPIPWGTYSGEEQSGAPPTDNFKYNKLLLIQK
jgi:hypothetical protein